MRGAAGPLRARTQALVALLLLALYAAFLTVGTHPAGTGILDELRNPVQAVNDQWLSPLGLRGLLSVIPTTALVLLGALAARPLATREPRQIWALLPVGVGLAALGVAWASLGGPPLSKTLWTPPYIFTCAGLGMLGLLICWLLADSGRVRGGAAVLAPLTIPGRNALVAYVLPILVKVWILQDWLVGWTGRAQPMGAALLTLAQRHLGPVGGGGPIQGPTCWRSGWGWRTLPGVA
ncbi:DUF418 domain-containing protein [Deinococcus multiflagellatus]|uniref:DUF418 domain-containing protein n=1 Tax=Deinococcus multiflagellatus TaxID=1656887 RepID=A0ABW1ZFD3_9DEIO